MFPYVFDTYLIRIYKRQKIDNDKERNYCAVNFGFAFVHNNTSEDIIIMKSF